MGVSKKMGQNIKVQIYGSKKMGSKNWVKLRVLKRRVNQNWNINNTQMIKKKEEKKGNVTKTDTSSKLKYFQNWNVTNLLIIY